MARKTISLLIMLSLFQAVAAAAVCDLDCLLLHSSAAAHVHPYAPHQHQQSSATGDTHCKHAHEAVSIVATISATVSSCHRGMSSGCAQACISSAKGSGTLASSERPAFAFHVAQIALPEILASRTPDLRPSFSPSRSAPTFTILRI